MGEGEEATAAVITASGDVIAAFGVGTEKTLWP